MTRAARNAPKLQRATRVLMRVRGPLVLAVSGGLDSMVLLHLVSRHRGLSKRCTVATFDHATGVHAKLAVRLVRKTSLAVGIPVVAGRGGRVRAVEAEWREERWRFLRSVARRRGATIVTAHTRDDQIETIVLRILRGANARGLAALFADSPVARPLLSVPRASMERYARAHGVQFVDDPTNLSRTFQRNRVRHDLLPAFRAVRPEFDRELLALSREAARLRRRTEAIARRLARSSSKPGMLELEAGQLATFSKEALALLWPALVAPLGVPLDRRGIARAAQFSLSGRPGQQVQCSGGITLERTRHALVVRHQALTPRKATVELASDVEFGEWTLRRVSRRAFHAFVAQKESVWGAAVDHAVLCQVRAWRPGDRVRANGRTSLRRIKRYFNEHGIPSSERRSWPVVVADGQVLWVPGICHSEAAIEKIGQPLTYMVCERRVS